MHNLLTMSSGYYPKSQPVTGSAKALGLGDEMLTLPVEQPNQLLGGGVDYA